MTELGLQGIVPLLVLFPLLATCFSFMVSGYRALIGKIALATHVLLAIIALELARHPPQVDLMLGGWAAPLGIALATDSISLVLACFTSLLFFVIGVSVRPPLSSQASDTFWPLCLCLQAGVVGLFLTRDLFNAYVLLEVVGLSAVGLVAISPGNAVHRAALNYLMVSIMGSLCFLFGVALVYRSAGVLDFSLIAQYISEHSQSLQIRLAAGFMTTGLLLKTALVPLHGWLPEAHGNALPAVSALLSGLVVKCGLYLCFVLWRDVFPAVLNDGFVWGIAICGMAAIFWGGWCALNATRLKILAAYSTVAQLGYLFLFFPLLHWLPEHQNTITYALIMFIMAHGLAKATLFLVIGEYKTCAGNDDILSMRGAAIAQPFLIFVLAVACVSLTGLPPSGGFTAKWLLLSLHVTAELWWLFAAVLAGGLLSATYLFRVLLICMTSDGPAMHPPKHQQSRWPWSTVSIGMLALLSVGLGFSGDWLAGLLAASRVS